MDGLVRNSLNAGNLFSSPKGLFDTNHPMELIDEPLAGMYHLFIIGQWANCCEYKGPARVGVGRCFPCLPAVWGVHNGTSFSDSFSNSSNIYTIQGVGCIYILYRRVCL